MNELIDELIAVLGLEAKPMTYYKINRVLAKYQSTRKVEIRKRYSKNLTEPEMDRYAEQSIKEYGINMKDFKSKKRDHNLVAARVHFARSIRTDHGVSVKAIGRYLQRDHTTVIHYLYNYKLPT